MDIPGKPHLDPVRASPGRCPLQSLPLWRVGNLRFWEGSGRWSSHPHPFACWAQSLPPWPALTVSPSPHFPLLPPRFSPVFSIPSLVIKLLPFFLQLFFLSTRLLCSPPLGLLSFSFFLPVFSLFPRTLTMYVSSRAFATAGLGGMGWDGMWWELV